MPEYIQKIVTFRSGRTTRILMPTAIGPYEDMFNREHLGEMLCALDMSNTPCFINLRTVESIIAPEELAEPDAIKESTKSDDVITQQNGTPIVVNGKTMVHHSKMISFVDLVAVSGLNPNRISDCTITYMNPGEANSTGIIYYGRSIEVKDGTEFNVVICNKA